MPRLTPRDHAILRDVWLHRYITTSQIHRLHFTHLKVAQRRLRILTEHGFVDQFRPKDATGFRTWWHRLSKQGARIVAKNEGLPLGVIVPPIRHPQKMGSLAHHELLTDFRIWLREACATSGFGYSFIPSYEETRENEKRQRRVALQVPGHNRLLIPDGAFTLQRKDKHALFMLEVDRGTEPLTGKHQSAIQRKFARYQSAFDSRAEDSYAHLFQSKFNGFRVLCLVPTEKRRQGFVELASRVGLSPLVWVATTNLVEEPGNLAKQCWAINPEEPPRALTE